MFSQDENFSTSFGSHGLNAQTNILTIEMYNSLLLKPKNDYNDENNFYFKIIQLNIILTTRRILYIILINKG